jgi:hypothetical protein
VRWLLALPALTLPFLPVTADGTWSATATGTATISAASMANATAFTATCAANTNGSVINLAWIKSTDTYVSSYVITRTGTVANTSTTITVAGTQSSYPDNPPTPHSGTYTYTIAAKVGTWWTTTASAPVSRGYTQSGANKCI